MQPTYHFPVLRGIQAGREFYLAMCPMKLVPKLFLYNEEEVPPELRAQRVLNRPRVPEIAKYITENVDEYVFSALTASIDASVEFRPLNGVGDERNIGILVVPMDATIIINDGQHRRAAIEEALKECPELGDEAIAVVFFADAGLKRSQQMFADLNKHAVRPAKSLGILYDYRDPLARLSIDLTNQVPCFMGLTELEKTSISNRSIKVFTLSAIYQATAALLGKRKNQSISASESQLASDYWTSLCNVLPEWQLAANRQVSGMELRRDFIHTHSVVLHALGIVGRTLIEKHPKQWKNRLKSLRNVDWSRSNSADWEGRVLSGGRIVKGRHNPLLMANYLKRILGLELSPPEVQAEAQLVNN